MAEPQAVASGATADAIKTRLTICTVCRPRYARLRLKQQRSALVEPDLERDNGLSGNYRLSPDPVV